jgi:2-keto-4-pentenoate hydratase
VTDPQTFAEDIATRHRARAEFTLDVPEGRAGDMDFAYAVQDRLVPLLAGDAPAAGYKIGLTTPRMQQMCGVDEPIVGVIFAGRVQVSPARAAVADFVRLGIESEIALRIGRPFPLGEAVPPERVLDYVDAVCAAFEMIDDSNADYGRLSAVTLVADNAWNAGLVVGPMRSAAEVGALGGRKGVLFRDDEIVDTGNSSDVLGDPALALAWVVRNLASRGRALVPGQWVSTGAIVPTRPVAAGQTWRFEVEGLEPVEMMVG